MIAECPLTVACRVVHTVDQPRHEFLVGDLAETWCSPDCLTEGRPDIAEVRPFTLTMPDDRYWAVSAQIGTAWSDGRGFGQG